MANTIAHLIISNEILNKYPNLVSDKEAFLVGSVSVDCNALREDKRKAHLREGIKDSEWKLEENMNTFLHRLRDFNESYVICEQGYQRDFNLGYMVHLLVDLFNYKTIRNKMISKISKDNYKETDRDFFYLITNDLEYLDYYLLTHYKDAQSLKNTLLSYNHIYHLDGYVSISQIDSSIEYWNNTYFPNICKRELKYLGVSDILEFISGCVDEVLNNLEFLHVLNK